MREEVETRDELVDQVVYEHRPGYGVIPVRTTLSDGDLDRLDRGLFLNRHIHFSPELPGGGNLFYKQFGRPEDRDRWAMLIYRELEPLNRRTSRAHVLFARANVLTSVAAVAMWDWPWPMQGEDDRPPALTYQALQGKAEEIRRSWRETVTSATHRLLIELMCHGEELAVKARPGLRKDLLTAVAKLAPGALDKGFSVHETKYDESKKSLPRLCFVSEKQDSSSFDIRRRVVDLDAEMSDPEVLAEIARRLAGSYGGTDRGALVRALEQKLSRSEKTIREVLDAWSVPVPDRVPGLYPDQGCDSGSGESNESEASEGFDGLAETSEGVGGSETGSATGSETGSETGSATGSATGSETGSATGSATLDHIGDSGAGSQAPDSIGGSGADSKTPDNVGGSATDSDQAGDSAETSDQVGEEPSEAGKTAQERTDSERASPKQAGSKRPDPEPPDAEHTSSEPAKSGLPADQVPEADADGGYAAPERARQHVNGGTPLPEVGVASSDGAGQRPAGAGGIVLSQGGPMIMPAYPEAGEDPVRRRSAENSAQFFTAFCWALVVPLLLAVFVLFVSKP